MISSFDRVVSKTVLEVNDGRVRQLIELPESRAALRTFVTVESDQISEDDAWAI